jgi:iron-sulfur cluster repair protein YtfE (RIC family)
MDLRIPGSLKDEHERLYQELNRAARIGGDVGDAALLAFKEFEPHMRKEERIAFPMLDLLGSLAEKEVTTMHSQAIKLGEDLKGALSGLYKDHEVIRDALHRMNDAAMREQKPEYASLAKRAMHHLMLEEQILYPAAVLAGEYVRLSLYGPPAKATK